MEIQRYKKLLFHLILLFVYILPLFIGQFTTILDYLSNHILDAVYKTFVKLACVACEIREIELALISIECDFFREILVGSAVSREKNFVKSFFVTSLTL